jgi:predicted transcriptional regulator
MRDIHKTKARTLVTPRRANVAHIIALLKAQPRSAKELARLTETDVGNVQFWLNAFEAEGLCEPEARTEPVRSMHDVVWRWV